MSDLNSVTTNNQFDSGELITRYARERALYYGGLYAKHQAPISPYEKLTSNKEPDKSLITWLRGVNKCNQFVGDVLIGAGFKMPTFKMKDGSEHYLNAERLPKQTKYFDKICNLEDLKAGDILVLDDLSRKGENGAHVELITYVDFAKKLIKLIGARSDGAAERESQMLKELSNEDCGFLRKNKNQKVYFLRPKVMNY